MSELLRGEQMELQPVTQLTVEEARDLTEEIKRSGHRLWSLLLRAHDQKAWSVLGYKSWREYASTEFQISQQRAYQLLAAARIHRALEDGSHSTIVEISEGHARELSPLRENGEQLAAAWREAIARADGKPTARDVRSVVDQVLGRPSQPSRRKPRVKTDPDPVDPPDPASRAEIVELRPQQASMTYAEAQALCDRIAMLAEDLFAVLEEAYARRVFEVLNYRDWTHLMSIRFRMDDNPARGLVAQRHITRALAERAEARRETK
jgi:hypothetical protein